MMKKRASLAAIALVVSAAAACSSNDASNATALDDGSLARVQEANKLVVCSSNDVPYFYKNPDTGELEGTDYEMVKAIAERLNIDEIEMFEVPISGIIPSLTSKRCDIIADNLAITAERSEQITFSSPMYQAGQALVVPEGNPAHITSVEDSSGRTVGSYLGTVQLEYLLELQRDDPSIEVKQYKNIPEILADLEAGRLDAGVFDDMVAAYTIKTNPSLPIEIINYQLPIGDYAVGAGFRKDDRALRAAFNDVNRELMFDGTITEILEDWGMTPIERYAAFPGCCDSSED
jgi:polar amino acid transport system substrate-binding protein